MMKSPKITQAKFAFVDRPHHRTTILTVDGATYRKVANLKPAEELLVEFVNDIVSSARGGNSKIHHSIRRVDLLRRQLSTEFRNVKVRTEPDMAINCTLIGSIKGESDACSAKVFVRKRY